MLIHYVQLLFGCGYGMASTVSFCLWLLCAWCFFKGRFSLLLGLCVTTYIRIVHICNHVSLLLRPYWVSTHFCFVGQSCPQSSNFSFAYSWDALLSSSRTSDCSASVCHASTRGPPLRATTCSQLSCWPFSFCASNGFFPTVAEPTGICSQLLIAFRFIWPC